MALTRDGGLDLVFPTDFSQLREVRPKSVDLSRTTGFSPGRAYSNLAPTARREYSPGRSEAKPWEKSGKNQSPDKGDINDRRPSTFLRQPRDRRLAEQRNGFGPTGNHGAFLPAFQALPSLCPSDPGLRYRSAPGCILAAPLALDAANISARLTSSHDTAPAQDKLSIQQQRRPDPLFRLLNSFTPSAREVPPNPFLLTFPRLPGGIRPSHDTPSNEAL